MPEAQLGPASPQSPHRTEEPPTGGDGDPVVGPSRLADEPDQPPIIQLAPFPRLTPRAHRSTAGRDGGPVVGPSRLADEPDQPPIIQLAPFPRLTPRAHRSTAGRETSAAGTLTARRHDEPPGEPPETAARPRCARPLGRRRMATWETVPMVVVIMLLAVLGALVLERWGPRADPPELAGRAGPEAGEGPGRTVGTCSADQLAAALPDDNGLTLIDDAPRCEQGYALARLEPDVASSGRELAAFRLADDGTWEGFAIIRASDCGVLGDVVDPDLPASLC